MEIEPKKTGDIITKEVIDDLTRAALKLPQADCPVAHYFGPGTYIRQVTFPAGVFAIGHKQRHAQMNIFINGRLAMFQEDGSIKELRAPMIFNGGPGQKMGICLETVTWLNVYPNPDDERDIDTLENKWLDKEGPWTESEESRKKERRDSRQADRDDYKMFLEECDLSENQVRKESESISDLIDLPEAFYSIVTVRQSDIEGKGIFASWPYKKGMIIGPARIENKRTQIGRYTNHSKNPNSKFVQNDFGDIVLVAIKDISGCRGGDQGEEITVDYRESYERIKRCQALQQQSQ